ncbi:hypothetical protein AK812_SmicGene11003 [Symbiodinium microadriaticum]|uniref:Cyclic nucleotide-binding domain-containing protein n=1 Tax=Symbiodinium microadriaticum TaxID=2951 RepID=A0A1Q9EEA3_SYMMI|nr:hypothetical protein AK812_SmicGene11003 [Symbiodinium microadriaticum]
MLSAKSGEMIPIPAELKEQLLLGNGWHIGVAKFIIYTVFIEHPSPGPRVDNKYQEPIFLQAFASPNQNHTATRLVKRRVDEEWKALLQHMQQEALMIRMRWRGHFEWVSSGANLSDTTSRGASCAGEDGRGFAQPFCVTRRDEVERGKRRELRIFLQTKQAPTELVLKVMSYADYKMARHSPIAFDETLISQKLEAELATFQHGDYLREHPIFWLVDTLFPLVFNDLCSTLEKQLFCEGEAVFRHGTLAEMMYISSHGNFRICTDAQATKKFSGPHYYFAEVALYVEASMHDCTLLAESFTEVFILTSAKLATVLANSPVCAAMYIEYANEYISHFVVMSPDAEVEEVVEAHLQNAENSCENNSFYLDMYVDERKQLSSLQLAPHRSQPQVRLSFRKSESASSLGSGDVAIMTRTKSFHHRARTMKSQRRQHEDEHVRHISPKEFVAKVLETDLPTTTLVNELRDAFVELDPDDGLHARFSDSKEQDTVPLVKLRAYAQTKLASKLYNPEMQGTASERERYNSGNAARANYSGKVYERCQMNISPPEDLPSRPQVEIPAILKGVFVQVVMEYQKKPQNLFQEIPAILKGVFERL